MKIVRGGIWKVRRGLFVELKERERRGITKENRKRNGK